MLAAGCADDGTPKGNSSPTQAAFPVTVGSLTLAAQPTRIVSLSATATEQLFAIDAGSQVVAVDDQSNYPTSVPKSDLSGYTPSAEAIAAKQPDLVVLSNDINKIVSQLQTLKIPVFVAPAPADLDGVYQQIADLGRLTGHVSEATAEIQRMKDSIDKIVKSVPVRSTPLTYYLEVDNTLYAETSKTFLGNVFAQFGMVNIADPADDGSKGGYPQLTEEAIFAANPDVIFLLDAGYGETPDKVKARPGWSNLGAVKNNQVYGLNQDTGSRWGPRLVDAAQEIADAVAKVPQ
jgi:iron complex transport system substrate-binding protein